MLLNFLLFAGSMLGIIIIARFALYDPAQKLAAAARLSKPATGQLLGYLTSAPELVATVFVAATGLFSVVSYNILGSNIANVLLALAAALWFKQFTKITHASFRFEHAVIILSIVVPIGLLLTGTDNAIWAGIALFSGYLLYLYLMKQRPEPPGLAHPDADTVSIPVARIRRTPQVLILIFGLVSLYILGAVLGDSIYELGTAFGISALILGGLTAIATSLPELTTFFASYAAHRKANTDGNAEVLHNVMASSVMNLFFIQAIGIGIYHIAL